MNIFIIKHVVKGSLNSVLGSVDGDSRHEKISPGQLVVNCLSKTRNTADACFSYGDKPKQGRLFSFLQLKFSLKGLHRVFCLACRPCARTDNRVEIDDAYCKCDPNYNRQRGNIAES